MDISAGNKKVELSTRILKPLCIYLENTIGKDKFRELILQTNMAPEFLDNESNWISYRYFINFLGKMVEQVGDFQPGRPGYTILWKADRVGVQICYEIIFPNLSRQMVRNGATVLVNITNDAWFGRTSAPFQHFSMAVFRAVENRRSLARAANTGISGFVDPAGRVLASTALLKEAAVTRSIPLLKEKTVYTSIGDLFARGCMAVVILAALLELIGWGIERRKG